MVCLGHESTQYGKASFRDATTLHALAMKIMVAAAYKFVQNGKIPSPHSTTTSAISPTMGKMAIPWIASTTTAIMSLAMSSGAPELSKIATPATLSH